MCLRAFLSANRQGAMAAPEKGQAVELPKKMMNEIRSSESHPKRQEQIIVQKGSGDVFLFNMEHGSYYALNEVGNRIWELCDGTNGVGQLVSTLAKEYDAPAEVIQTDILE